MYLRHQVGELFGVESNSIDELKGSPEFLQSMTDQTAVVRVFGWVGYFWWEFLQDLSDYKTIGICERLGCGSVLTGGHRDRRFCTKEENPECFRRRNADAQRRSRFNKETAPEPGHEA